MTVPEPVRAKDVQIIPQPPVRGEEFRRLMSKALTAKKKTARSRRGQRARPQITGIRINPGRQP